MNIMFEKKTIEVTKAELQRARKYGSEECELLLKITRDLPDFQIVVKKNPVRRTATIGYTYSYMEACIAQHDEDGSMMEDFETLRQLGTPYATIKKWFLERIPAANLHLAA